MVLDAEMGNVELMRDLVPLADYQGVRVFMVPGERMPADVIYVPFRSGCEVQPYRRAADIQKLIDAAFESSALAGAVRIG